MDTGEHETKKGTLKGRQNRATDKRTEEGSILQKMEPYMNTPQGSLSLTENSKNFYREKQVGGKFTTEPHVSKTLKFLGFGILILRRVLTQGNWLNLICFEVFENVSKT